MKIVFNGSVIREKRMKKGWTLTRLAQFIDPTKVKSLSVSISGYESGENIPNALTLMYIAGALECHITEFFEVMTQ